MQLVFFTLIALGINVSSKHVSQEIFSNSNNISVHYYRIVIYSDTACVISAASESGNLMCPASTN